MSTIRTLALLLALATLEVLTEDNPSFMTLATRLPFTILPATNLLGGRGVDVGFVLGALSIPAPDPPGGSLPTGGIQ